MRRNVDRNDKNGENTPGEHGGAGQIGRTSNKAERLLQIEALLLTHPEGLAQADVARHLGVNRSTVCRYLPDLKRSCVCETDDGRLAIDRERYQVQVELTLHEAMALHLGTRAMVTRIAGDNAHAASALRKLGAALEHLAPRISRHLIASAGVMQSEAQRCAPSCLEALEALTRAWARGCVAHLWYRDAAHHTDACEFAPYFVEPCAIGRATVAVGWQEPPWAVRTLKIGDVQRVELTSRHYTIPEHFDPRGYLADPWRMASTEARPVEVVLKFHGHPDRGHPGRMRDIHQTPSRQTERLEEQPDGSVIWHAPVADPREIARWIRGWGGDVEVLAPPELRDWMMGEARRLAETYGWQVSPVGHG